MAEKNQLGEKVEVSKAAEARKQHQKKCHRTVPFLVRWINSLHPSLEGIEIPPTSGSDGIEIKRITPNNVFAALRNGLLLCEICQIAATPNDEGIQILKGINRRPLTKNVMVKNLEICLRYLWQKSVRATHMCTALDFYLEKKTPPQIDCVVILCGENHGLP